jgi:hypothetical protein
MVFILLEDESEDRINKEAVSILSSCISDIDKTDRLFTIGMSYKEINEFINKIIKKGRLYDK